ncbi:MAG: ABC transporter ATP-binding protein [Peptostreptococcaceae bacterium]|nr:ABC transporter ATP-binding protein [Peptostreptococcaceae bacterium]
MFEVKNLVFGYDDKNILKDISLTIRNYKMVGIIGPNGSGKSTLLKCIYRVLKPQGTILFDGKNLNDYSFRESAQKMAVVAQHNDSSFDFNVLEMVLIGRSPHKKFMERENHQDIEMAYDALRTVDMFDFANRSFSSLSGGEKQRIVLARALVQNTQCLILDEPTNHLDIKHQLHFMQVAKDLDATVISAIHDLNIATMYCDYIFALKDGEILDYGVPEKVINEDIIQKLYGVRAKVVMDEEIGKLHIMYRI